MPNVIAKLVRYILRRRKRSASSQNSSAAQFSATTQNTTGIVTKNDESEIKDSEREDTEKSNTRDEPRSSIDNDTNPVTRTQNEPLKLSTEMCRPSTVRTRRVMRELQNTMKSAENPESPFKISLVNESNIFEWEVKLVRVDENSDLWRSMRETQTESIDFRLTFPELFPFHPPFLRLVRPYIDNGFIMDGGAICMEVLTSQGWSGAYTVESLLVQVASDLTQGGAVVSNRQKRKYNRMTQKRAEVEFRRICKIHAKYGWVSMERDEMM